MIQDSETPTADIPAYHIEKPHPNTPIICIPDIHADPLALALSLQNAGIIECVNRYILVDWRVTQKALTHTIVLLGDLFDRGPDNLGTLKLIADLQTAGVKIEIVLGNHDAEWLQKFTYHSEDALWEMAKENEKKLTQAAASLVNNNIDEVVFENRRFLNEIITQYHATNAEMFGKNTKTILQNDMVKFHAAVRHGDMLFVHSDVSTKIASALNNVDTGTFYVPVNDHVSATSIHKCFYRRSRDETFLQEDIRKQLRNVGIMYVIRGHEINAYNPDWDTRYSSENLHILNMDAGISGGLKMNAGKSQWCFMEFNTKEEFIGHNSRGISLRMKKDA